MAATDAGVMRNRQPGKWIVAGTGLLGTLLAAGRADAYSYYPDGMVEAVVAGAVLVPSEVGVAIPNLSPELGVKFLHAEGPSKSDGVDMSLHLLARAEIAPDAAAVRGVTVLLGWNLL